jgi:hypothetical protein
MSAEGGLPIEEVASILEGKQYMQGANVGQYMFQAGEVVGEREVPGRISPNKTAGGAYLISNGLLHLQRFSVSGYRPRPPSIPDPWKGSSREYLRASYAPSGQ